MVPNTKRAGSHQALADCSSGCPNLPTGCKENAQKYVETLTSNGVRIQS